MAISPEQNPKINVRQIREEDITSVLAIDSKITGSNRALTYTDIPYSYVGGEMDISVVAEIDGQIVGFLFGQMKDSQQSDTALMLVMGVDPMHHHHGIGTALVQGFIKRCQQKGVKSVHTLASWQDWWMLSFLNSLGFARGEMAEFVKPIDN